MCQPTNFSAHPGLTQNENRTTKKCRFLHTTFLYNRGEIFKISLIDLKKNTPPPPRDVFLHIPILQNLGRKKGSQTKKFEKHSRVKNNYGHWSVCYHET